MVSKKDLSFSAMNVTINVNHQELWRKRKEGLERLLENSRQFHNADQMTDETVDSKLYESAKKGNVDAFIDVLEQVSSKKQLSLSTIFTQQLTPSGNSLLHVAASYGSEDIAQLLADGFQDTDFFSKKNLLGDTALHLAARAGKLSTVKLLLAHGVDPSMQNNNIGNTAFHCAVIGRHYDVVKELLKKDPKVFFQANHERESPLYLAVQDSDERMVDILLEASDSFIKPEGKSPMHAAIHHKRFAIMEKIANRMPELVTVDDEKLGSPIHFASSVGFHEGVGFLLDKLGDRTLRKKQDGLYAVHVAAQEGHVQVVMEFAKKWPYPLEFLNAKDQNILHVAAENGRLDLVRYILKNIAQPEDVNVQDKKGNTPLHLAAKNGHPRVVFVLVRDQRVKGKAVNNKNLTPYDIAESQFNGEEEECEKSNGKEKQADTGIEKNENLYYQGLEKEAEPDIEKNENLDYQGLMKVLLILCYYTSPRILLRYPLNKNKALTTEDIKGRIESLLVVAALVAGVTFAGAVTLPGIESKNDASHNNETSMAARYLILRNVCLLFDMAAFSMAVVASFKLCKALLHVELASDTVWEAALFIGIAMCWMWVALFYAVAIAASSNAVLLDIISAIGICVYFFLAHYIIYMIPQAYANFWYIRVFYIFIMNLQEWLA